MCEGGSYTDYREKMVPQKIFMLECDVSNDLGETMDILLWILGGLGVLAGVFVLAMITAVFVEGTSAGDYRDEDWGLDDD